MATKRKRKATEPTVASTKKGKDAAPTVIVAHSIPVDKGFDILYPDANVYESFSFLANRNTGVSNKFFCGQVITCGTIPCSQPHYYFFKRWGRVGQTGQKSIEGPYTDVAQAIKSFRNKVNLALPYWMLRIDHPFNTKQFMEISGHRWAGRLAFYPAPFPVFEGGKYSVMNELILDSAASSSTV